jgi:hypothetical protein
LKILYLFSRHDGEYLGRMGSPLTSGTYFTQGIGFINANTGWLGGDFSINITYETTNGGNTWIENPFGRWVNRIRFLNDTLGYAVGQGVYKYTSEKGIGIINLTNEIPETFNIRQNFPNPFNPSTVIMYEVPYGVWISLEIYNVVGQKIKTLYEGFESAGIYSTKWDGTDLNGNFVSSGLYFYKLSTGEHTLTRKMVLIK